MAYPWYSFLQQIKKQQKQQENMTMIPQSNSTMLGNDLSPEQIEQFKKSWTQTMTGNSINFPKKQILFVKTHPDAILPKKNHSEPLTGDAGYDLFAVETTTIPARGHAVVPVGLKLGYIQPGFWIRIEARSGNGFKKNLEPHPGIIDNPYRGDLGIKLFNLSDKDQIIEKGAGAAQFIIYKMEDDFETRWISEEEVEITNRGENGFGSSDKR